MTMSNFKPPTKADFTALRKQLGTMTEGFSHYQSIRDRYSDGEPLTGADTEDLLALLRAHPAWKRKTADGVTGFTVLTLAYGSTVSRAFHLIDDGGTPRSFSYVKCLRNAFGSVEWRHESRRKRTRHDPALRQSTAK